MSLQFETKCVCLCDMQENIIEEPPNTRKRWIACSG